MIAPTQRQRQLMKFIQDYTAKKGYSPSLRDMGSALNIQSTNGVLGHLRSLEKKGYVLGAKGVARAVRLTGRPVEVMAPVATRAVDLEEALRDLVKVVASLDLSAVGFGEENLLQAVERATSLLMSCQGKEALDDVL